MAETSWWNSTFLLGQSLFTCTYYTYTWFVSLIAFLFQYPSFGDLHLHFCSEMIKQNLEQHNWRPTREKGSKAIVNFWVVFRYSYIPPLQKNGFTMFWYLNYTWITDSLSELTLLLFSLMDSHQHTLLHVSLDGD